MFEFNISLLMLDYFILTDLLDPQDRKKMITFPDHTILGQVSAFIWECNQDIP